MKIFLSWSGETSRRLAEVFEDWLQDVMHFVKPYLSSDIQKGERWSTDIAVELAASQYGIVFLTKSNVGEPWINFEAGAISKTVGPARVVPFLFDLKGSELQGPLVQFQYALNSRNELEKLVSGINDVAPVEFKLEKELLRRSFDRCWPELEARVSEIRVAEPPVAKEARKVPPEMAILEELLDLSRTGLKVLKSVEGEIVLSPPGLEDAQRWGLVESYLKFVDDLADEMVDPDLGSDTVDMVDRLRSATSAVRDNLRSLGLLDRNLRNHLGPKGALGALRQGSLAHRALGLAEKAAAPDPRLSPREDSK